MKGRGGGAPAQTKERESKSQFAPRRAVAAYRIARRVLADRPPSAASARRKGLPPCQLDSLKLGGSPFRAADAAARARPARTMLRLVIIAACAATVQAACDAIEVAGTESTSASPVRRAVRPGRACNGQPYYKCTCCTDYDQFLIDKCATPGDDDDCEGGQRLAA